MSDPVERLREQLLDTLSRVPRTAPMREAPSMVILCPNPMSDRQAAALTRAFDEGWIKIPLLRATVEVNERGENDEIILRFEPEEIRVIVDPSG